MGLWVFQSDSTVMILILIPIIIWYMHQWNSIPFLKVLIPFSNLLFFLYFIFDPFHHRSSSSLIISVNSRFFKRLCVMIVWDLKENSHLVSISGMYVIFVFVFHLYYLLVSTITTTPLFTSLQFKLILLLNVFP